MSALLRVLAAAVFGFALAELELVRSNRPGHVDLDVVDAETPTPTTGDGPAEPPLLPPLDVRWDEVSAAGIEKWACGFTEPVPNSALEPVAPSADAIESVLRILQYVGLPQTFDIYSANVSSAAAGIKDGRRVVYYGDVLLGSRTSDASRTSWYATSILAHEVGHHLSGHTLGASSTPLADEIAADHFSGFVLHAMGASLENAQAGVAALVDFAATESHPGRADRMAAVAAGWYEARNLRPSADLPVPPDDSVFGQQGVVTQFPFFQRALASNYYDKRTDAGELHRDAIASLPPSHDCTVVGPSVVALYSIETHREYWSDVGFAPVPYVFEFPDGSREKIYVDREFL